LNSTSLSETAIVLRDNERKKIISFSEDRSHDQK